MVFLLAIAQNQRFWVDLRNFLFKVSPIFELAASEVNFAQILRYKKL